MLWLTEDAVLVCKHELGRVDIVPSQSLVTIHRRRVLVEDDPEKRPIKGCPGIPPTFKRCTNSLRVRAGYSTFVRIAKKPVCLDTVVGRTDGMPAGTVDYKVRRPGQAVVSEKK